MDKATERSAEMGRVVEEYEKSGLRRREFCEKRGLSITTLDYWRRERRSSPRMVPVEVTPAECGAGFTLSLAKGRRIECSWAFGEAELARLIRVVESA